MKIKINMYKLNSSHQFWVLGCFLAWSISIDFLTCNIKHPIVRIAKIRGNIMTVRDASQKSGAGIYGFEGKVEHSELELRNCRSI